VSAFRLTVTRSIGNRIELATFARPIDAAHAFLNEALALIAAFGMRDTYAGWRFYMLAKRLARALATGELVGADIAFEGERVTFMAGA
jgi:hypothetical protein